jgi:hypothetical protein
VPNILSTQKRIGALKFKICTPLSEIATKRQAAYHTKQEQAHAGSANTQQGNKLPRY